MSVLAELKQEIENAEGAKELPETVRVVMKIAECVETMKTPLPRDLVFKAAVQALYGKMEL